MIYPHIMVMPWIYRNLDEILKIIRSDTIVKT